MSDSGAENGARYWAFISYSHKDAAFGRRLHRRLEGYTLPRRLVGRATQQGTVPRKLAPIFRDRDELPAAKDLSAEVRAALAASRSLIVVCSPSAAASPWVGREIEAFRELHPDRPVLAAIRAGEPADCFPDALSRTGPDGAVLEPLAADFRKDQDGDQLGLLKLVAGIVGVGLDELVQRDAIRRTQRVTAVTAGALAAMIVMGVLTVFAFTAQREAERQRGEAEGLIGFMSNDSHSDDLRTMLEGVGRVEIMRAVNKRALEYYDREINSLRPESRARRARVLLADGEDLETLGHSRLGRRRFEEAFSATKALLEADPNNPERVFDHAQSVYYLGFDDYMNGRYQRMKAPFEEYKRLAERMIKLAPNEPRYLRELAFAEGDLCSVAFYPPKDPKAALSMCTLALQHMQAAVSRMPPSIVLQDNLYNRQSWLADAYHANGNEAEATVHRQISTDILDRLMKAEPMNTDFKSRWIAAQRNLARGEVRAGKTEQARTRLTEASALIDQMVVFDPGNKEWQELKRKLDSERAGIESGRNEKK